MNAVETFSILDTALAMLSQSATQISTSAQRADAIKQIAKARARLRSIWKRLDRTNGQWGSEEVLAQLQLPLAYTVGVIDSLYLRQNGADGTTQPEFPEAEFGVYVDKLPSKKLMSLIESLAGMGARVVSRDHANEVALAPGGKLIIQYAGWTKGPSWWIWLWIKFAIIAMMSLVEALAADVGSGQGVGSGSTETEPIELARETGKLDSNSKKAGGFWFQAENSPTPEPTLPDVAPEASNSELTIDLELVDRWLFPRPRSSESGGSGSSGSGSSGSGSSGSGSSGSGSSGSGSSGSGSSGSGSSGSGSSGSGSGSSIPGSSTSSINSYSSFNEFSSSNSSGGGQHPRPRILLTGYWPPTNDMLVDFSPTRKSTNRAPAAPAPPGKAWEGENWRDLGFDIFSYYPTFPANFPYLDQWLSVCFNAPSLPNPATWWGRGIGDFEINYASAAIDFWKYTAMHKPLAVFTFSQTPKQLFDPAQPNEHAWKNSYQWEIEEREVNRETWTTTLPNPVPGLSPLEGCTGGMPDYKPEFAHWIDDGPGHWENIPGSPFQGEARPPGFNGPDPTRPTNAVIESGIPIGLRNAIAAHLNGAFPQQSPGVPFATTQGGNGGGFVSGYTNYLSSSYKHAHNIFCAPDYCAAGGHTHIGEHIPWQTARDALKSALQQVIIPQLSVVKAMRSLICP